MIPRETISGIVLAGGQSRRMGGQDKSWLDLNGTPAVERALERLRPQVANIAINTNADPAPFERFGVPILADTLPDYPGPLAGILTAMKWASTQPGVTHVASVATDTPFFPTDFVQRLSAAAPDTVSIVMAQSGPQGDVWTHPVFALWPVVLSDALERYLTVENERKIILFSQRHNQTNLHFGQTPDPFFNINTPHDLARAQDRLRENG
ncbi:MAG: molybdenum cofactor guanylyltransferase MobA [Pseudomonadota bacterium]